MIANIQGEVAAVGEDWVVVQVGGVGLRVFAPAAVCAGTRPGERIFLHTQLIVREDLLALYGFEQEVERETFNLLLGVSGIGPRIALAIVSTLAVDAIRRAVLHEDADAFSRVPGVGKKTGQKILLHLQGKIAAEGPLQSAVGMTDADLDVLEGLVRMGYSVVEAQSAVQSIPRDAPRDEGERLRIALQYFSR